MDLYLQLLDNNKRKGGNRGLATFLNANSSLAGQ
jgi:hypothetical protein